MEDNNLFITRTHCYKSMSDVFDVFDVRIKQ